MHMTRQHFRLIADVLKEAGEDGIEVDQLIGRFANALYRTNPNFDRDRFERACRGLK